MKINIVTISNNKIELNIDEKTNVEDIKKIISEIFKCSIDQINLYFNSKMLYDDSNLIKEGILEGSNIILHIQKNKINIKFIEKTKSTQKNSEKIEAIPITIPKLNDIKNIEKKDGPRESPLPLFQNNLIFNDPKNFNELIDSLIKLGFNKEDSILALRSSSYSLDLAANFLLNEFIPELPSAPNNTNFEPLSEYSKLLLKFNQTEIEIIKKIEKLGFDSILVMQIFEACDKNEEETLKLLNELKK